MDKGHTGILNSNHFRKLELAYLEELQPKSPRDNTHSYLVLLDPSQNRQHAVQQGGATELLVMAIRGKWNNSAKKNDKNQISSYVSSRPKWLPSTEIWGPWDKYPGRRSCRRNQVTWYKSEQSDWFGINYHIGILVYRNGK